MNWPTPTGAKLVSTKLAVTPKSGCSRSLRVEPSAASTEGVAEVVVQGHTTALGTRENGDVLTRCHGRSGKPAQREIVDRERDYLSLLHRHCEEWSCAVRRHTGSRLDRNRCCDLDPGRTRARSDHTDSRTQGCRARRSRPTKHDLLSDERGRGQEKVGVCRVTHGRIERIVLRHGDRQLSDDVERIGGQRAVSDLRAAWLHHGGLVVTNGPCPELSAVTRSIELRHARCLDEQRGHRRRHQELGGQGRVR